MRVKVLGCGDALGSGGRLNTCFLLEHREDSLLLDCGATALVAMRQFGVDPNQIGGIVLSHLHADHFGGLPTFLLDAQLVSRRTRPLVVAGPEGLQSRIEALMEAHFPGSTSAARRFAVEFIELSPGMPVAIGHSATVTGHLVQHPSGSPSLALRVTCDGRTVAYTGDTDWVDAVIAAGRHADLLFAEAYCYERKVRFHLDYTTLRSHLPAIQAKRVVLVHMSLDMLARVADVDECEVADDGAQFDIP